MIRIPEGLRWGPFFCPASWEWTGTLLHKIKRRERFEYETDLWTDAVLLRPWDGSAFIPETIFTFFFVVGCLVLGYNLFCC